MQGARNTPQSIKSHTALKLSTDRTSDGRLGPFGALYITKHTAQPEKAQNSV